jgi:hypothetical protein
VQEILVDGGQLVLQYLVQVLDDFLVALHRFPYPFPNPDARSREIIILVPGAGPDHNPFNFLPKASIDPIT